MESAQFLYELLRDGGPVAMAAVFASMWWLERQAHVKCRTRQAELSDKLLDLAVAQTAAVVKLEPTLDNLKDLILQLLNRR